MMLLTERPPEMWSSIEFGNHRPGWIKETLECIIYIYAYMEYF